MNNNIDEKQLISQIIDRIDALRVERGYSIYELANKSDVTINTIKHLYRKKSLPNLKTIYNLCDAFEIPVWLFFYNSNDISYYHQLK